MHARRAAVSFTTEVVLLWLLRAEDPLVATSFASQYKIIYIYSIGERYR